MSPHRVEGLLPLPHQVGNQLRDHLGVGLGLAGDAGVRLKLGAQLAEVLDDAVMHEMHRPGGVGMRIRDSVTPPWVAQRVWPMPMVPRTGSAAHRA